MSESSERLWLFEHTHLKMSWVQHQIRQKDGIATYPVTVSPSSFSSPYSVPFHDDSSSSPAAPSSSGTRISPAVLFIIVILAVLFFISGILHLLVRFLMKQPSSSSSTQSNGYPEISESDALQRQLQQLFHLHDSGLDQAFIDALPVFHFKELVGLKEQFDCAVCLCEFTDKDKLRLLPACSHAFHITCIDTWLLSNSTCPLCRGALYSPGFPIQNPVFDLGNPREEDGVPGNGEIGVPRLKNVKILETEGEKGVFPVRLGKFKKIDPEALEAGGETSSSNLDARRCYSMGSYQYVVRDANLRVSLGRHQDARDVKLVKGIDNNRISSVDGDVEGRKSSFVSKGDSFSVSKIWLWSKKDKFASSSGNQNMELPWLGGTQGV